MEHRLTATQCHLSYGITPGMLVLVKVSASRPENLALASEQLALAALVLWPWPR